MAWKKQRAARADECANWLMGAGTKTYHDFMRRFGLTRSKVYRLVRDVRLMLDNGPLTLICTADGQGRPWRYTITGIADEARSWQAWSLGYTESRLYTILSVSTSIALATKGNTREGRKARIIKVAAESAIAQLALVE